MNKIDFTDIEKQQIINKLFTRSIPDHETGCLNWIGAHDEEGRGRITLQTTLYYAYRLAFSVFIGPVPDGFLVCHSCDNGACINPEHLWLGTDYSNIHDCIEKRRTNYKSPCGEKSSNAKLTENQVKRIRKIYLEGRETMQFLANKYHVGLNTVCCIINRYTWKHLD